jgi:hypothetical protein
MLDHLVPVVERREVPPGAAGADHPEPTTPLVERDPPPDREEVEGLIRAEVGVAVEAGGVDGGGVVGWWGGGVVGWWGGGVVGW